MTSEKRGPSCPNLDHGGGRFRWFGQCPKENAFFPLMVKLWCVSYLHHFSEIIIIEWSICDIIQSFRNLIGTGLWGVWSGSDSLVGNYTPHSSKTARISFVCGIHSIVHLVLTFFTCLIFFSQSLRNIKYLLLNKGWQVNQVQISKIIIIIVRRNFTAQL